MNAQLLPFPESAPHSFEERVAHLLRQIAQCGRAHQAVSTEAHATAALVCALGHDTTPRAVLEAWPQDDTFDIDSAMHTCIHIGYRIHTLSLHTNELDNRLLPCLFIAGDTLHTLIETRDEGIYAYDANHNRFVTLPIGAFGKGMLICPRVAARPSATQPQYWMRFISGHFRTHFIQLFSVSFVLNFIALSTPIFIMLVYDRVIGVHATHDLSYLAMGLGLALIIEGILRFMRGRHMAWLGTRIDTVSTHAIIERLLHLPANMIERASVASQLARIKGFEELRDFFIGPLFLTLIELPFTLVIFAVLASIAGPIALIPLAAAALYSILFFALRPHTRRLMQQAARSYSLAQQATLETFTSMETLRTGGMHDTWHAHIRDLSAEASYRMFRSSFFSSVLETIAYATTALAGLAILYIGVGRVLAGEMSSGALIACLMLSWRILTPIAMLCTMLPRLEQLKQTINQLDRLMQIAPEPYRAPSASDMVLGAGKVELRQVGIRYTRESEPVFAGLSFTAEPGMLVGIMGGNGCGKSTLLKLIMGLYQPQAGVVRIDSTDIRQFASSELRHNIAYVPQTPEFFTGTIAENLRLAHPLATDEELRSALREAGIWHDVERLPQGLNTLLDCSEAEGSPTLLSYRLNLARACLSTGKIVLCDELPYALLHDQYGEQYRSLLKRWQGTRTTFFVTHREDLILMADFAIGLRRNGSALIGNPALVVPKMKEESYETLSARAR